MLLRSGQSCTVWPYQRTIVLPHTAAVPPMRVHLDAMLYERACGGGNHRVGGRRGPASKQNRDAANRDVVLRHGMKGNEWWTVNGQ